MPCPCPRGAPGDVPPCILHLAFPATAGPRQGAPLRVRAPQRAQAWASGIVRRQSGTLRVGLSLVFGSSPIAGPPPPSPCSRLQLTGHHRLAAGANIDALHHHDLPTSV